MGGQLYLETVERDEAKRLVLLKRFDQYEWAGCRDLDCLPGCKGFDTETEAWNCERYRRDFAAFVQRQTCKHEWIDIRNSIALSGSMCSKCRALRAEDFDQ